MRDDTAAALAGTAKHDLLDATRTLSVYRTACSERTGSAVVASQARSATRWIDKAEQIKKKYDDGKAKAKSSVFLQTN